MLEEWKRLPKPQQEKRIIAQKKSEEQLLNDGIARYWKEWERMPDEGKPEQQLLIASIKHLTGFYQKWIDDVSKNPKSPNWLAPLLAVSAPKMADITIRSVVRLFLTRQTLNSSINTDVIPLNAPIAQQLIKLIADDMCSIVAFRLAKTSNYGDWKRQSKFIKTWTPKRCKAFSKKIGAVCKLTGKQKEDLGHNMLRIALSSDILESRIHYTQDKKKVLLVSLAPWIIKALSKQHEFLESMAMVYRPMITPPIPHLKEEDGGFLSPHLRKRLVKRYSSADGAEKHKNSRPSDMVLKGLNAMMNTEWSVNKQVLKVMKTMFESDHRTANLPSLTFKDFAFSSNYPKTGTKEEKAIWMRNSNEAWNTWYKEEQSRSRMLVRLVLAKKMSDANFFYMPYTLDFRGRSYSTCELLSCQGIDFDRGLVHFAYAKPQTERGLFWVKIHLANLFDQDKKSFDERIQWVEDNIEELKKVAEDPYTNKLWIDDKVKKNSSFQRLAAIFELFRTDGLTQLNVQMDGVNNGVQHWAAIMKDKDLAVLTNILPGPHPQDLYETIAVKTTTIIQKEQTSNNWYNKFLVKWNNKISRKITKRPTMCDAYGLTFYGMQKYIKEEGHLDWVAKEERNGAITELARAVKNGLGQTMTYPNLGKEWLRSVAQLSSECGKSLKWTTPTGFTVHHVYNKIQERVSYAQLFNKQALVFISVTNKISERGQYLGISPNWIHSLDAAHQFMTISVMVNNNITAYSFIHDSYGTHATDIDKMNQYLREEFINLHKENQLEAFKKEIETELQIILPALPKQGEDFDISEVLQSAYFFS